MTHLVSILAFGFWLGMRHATDADHVVAVSTLVSQRRKFGRAWLLGAFWGIGHAVTIALGGIAIILLKLEIPARLGLSMEFAVGLILILLGLMNIAGYRLAAADAEIHSHAHDHDDLEHRHDADHPVGTSHSHPHVHGPLHERWRALLLDVGRPQILRSLFVGLVHGLAGSAALSLLVLASIDSPREAAFFILTFCTGTLAGMLVLSVFMEFSMTRLAKWWRPADRALSIGTGVLSLLVGLYVAYETGWVHGLFRAVK